MKSKSKIKKVIKSNLSKHPLSTLDDRIEIVKSEFSENAYEIDFYFDAKKNQLDYYESKRGDVKLHYNYATKELHICNIDVYGDYKGHGHGGEFVRSLEDIAIQLGARKVVTKNSLNDSFWEHMGYSRLSDGRMPDYGCEIFF